MTSVQPTRASHLRQLSSFSNSGSASDNTCNWAHSLRSSALLISDTDVEYYDNFWAGQGNPGFRVAALTSGWLAQGRSPPASADKPTTTPDTTVPLNKLQSWTV